MNAADLLPLDGIDSLTERWYRALAKWRDERGAPLDGQSQRWLVRCTNLDEIDILYPYVAHWHVGGPDVTVEDALNHVVPNRRPNSTPSTEQMLKALLYAADAADAIAG